MTTTRYETTIANPVPPQDLTEILGYRFIYTYANGWDYELYVKNSDTIDYRIHSGHVGGRWVKDQKVNLVMLTRSVYKIAWTEPTGTSVALNFLPRERIVHGVIFFPQWIKQHGERTVLFQNDHLQEMYSYRDQGPTYPIYVVTEFAKITVIEHVGEDNEDVINCPPQKSSCASKP